MSGRARRTAASPLVVAVVAALAAAACATAPGSGGAGDGGRSAGLPSGLFDADERVLITDFQGVAALARAPRRLYAATDGGLLIRDLAFERWELPFTREDGYPEDRVSAMAYDPRDATVWLATDRGELIQVEPERKRVVDEWRLSEPVDLLVPGPFDASTLYGRTRSGWVAVDPFGRSTGRVSSSAVAAAIEANPDLAARGRLLDDPQFEASRPLLGWRGDRRYEVTDVAVGLRDGEVWIGTFGGGLELLDLYGVRPRVVPYGPVGRGSAAVLTVPGGVWFAPAETTDRYGIARADERLQSWQAWDDSESVLEAGDPPDLPVNSFASSGDILWAGGAGTLHWFDGSTWARQLLGTSSRDDRVSALAPFPGRPGGVWVGTERGLFLVSVPGGPPERLTEGIVRVYALASTGETLWAGGDRGLLVAEPSLEGGSPRARPDETPGSPLGRVTALAADEGVLYAGVERDLWVRRAGSWRRAAPLGATRVPIESVAARDGIVWMGTAEGVTIWDTRSDRVVVLSFASGDLPRARFGDRGVRDIALASDGTAWLATPAGALRILADR